MANNRELKPCPFCGADEVSLVKEDEYVFACCSQCCSMTRYVQSKTRAVELWNRRGLVVA